MKRLKKVLSLLLAGVIAVTSLVCGSVTAGAYYDKDKIAVSGEWLDNGEYRIVVNNFGAMDYVDLMAKAAADGDETIDTVYFNLWISFYKDYILCVDCSLYKTEIENNFRVVAYPYIDKNDGNGYHYLADEIKFAEVYQDSETDDGICIYLPSDSPLPKKLGSISSVYIYSEIRYETKGLNFSLLGDWYRVNTSFDGLAANDIPSAASKDISSLSFSKISDNAYTGKALKPDVAIKDGDKTLTKDTDYTLSYKNNKNIGTAAVTITGKGSYTGTKTVTFKIVPKKATLTAKKSSGKYTLSWKKISGIDKYQIQYSTDGGKTYKKLANVASDKTSCSKKLDTSKSYTFRIRSYKTVDGKKYYSSWSKAVTVK